MIEKKSFRRYNLEEKSKKEALTIRLNEEERNQLDYDKKILQQVKDSTAMKQLAQIGSKVLHDKKIAEIIDIILGNKRRNKRIGIVDFE